VSAARPSPLILGVPEPIAAFAAGLAAGTGEEFTWWLAAATLSSVGLGTWDPTVLEQAAQAWFVGTKPPTRAEVAEAIPEAVDRTTPRRPS
jgi:hypothetical protein